MTLRASCWQCWFSTKNASYVWQAIYWRKGWFLNPLCHLVIKAVRVDSPPCQKSPKSLAELLTNYRMNAGLSRDLLAAKLGVSIGTLKNWERGWTQPNRRFWKPIRSLLYPRPNL
jgi:DNA-binding XRE family transcriptional regulator